MSEKEFRADLHTHSTFSDGTCTPRELIAEAKKRGLSAISITDHDTVQSYSEAIEVAREETFWLGSGVEFSTMEKGKSVHILGYDIDVANSQLQDLCQRHIERRTNRNLAIVEKLSKKGMDIDLPNLDGSIGRPHIAQALIDQGYVDSIQEAFSKWIGDGKSCFDPGEYVTIQTTLDVIHAAGGKAFIAHPHLFNGSVRALLQYPFDGIECYYARFPRDQERRWLKLAKERDLLISGGSDFHGTVKLHNPLGASWVDEGTFHQIFEKNKWH